jgi:hypothetical protein
MSATATSQTEHHNKPVDPDGSPVTAHGRRRAMENRHSPHHPGRRSRVTRHAAPAIFHGTSLSHAQAPAPVLQLSMTDE